MRFNWIRRLINLSYPLGQGDGLVLVAGMPKSGTTAIAKLLGAASGLSVCSDPFNQLDERHVEFRDALFSGGLSIDRLWREQRQVFRGQIVKDPNFPILLPQLRVLFPKAKIVFIVRDPRENIRSILNRLKLPGDPKKLTSLPSLLSEGWRNVLSGRSPNVPGCDYLEHMAWRWRYSAEQYMDNRNGVLLIRYEDFNADRQRFIESCAARLGFSVSADISGLVNVQFQPKGTPIIDWQQFFGKEGLQKIDAIVAPLLHEFGYDEASKFANTHH